MLPNEAFDLQKQYETEDESLNNDNVYILYFKVNESSFALKFDSVHEVVDFFPYTKYPYNVEKHIGVINLRGNVIPVIDPFHQDLSLINSDDCKYVILETENEDQIGLIVNNPKKIEISNSEIEQVKEDKVISLDGTPLRYILASTILKNYEVTEDGLE